MKKSDRVVSLSPTSPLQYTGLLENFVAGSEIQTEIIISKSAYDSLINSYRHKFKELLERKNIEVYLIDQTLPYSLWVLEHDEHPIAGITVYQNGGIQGVLMNESEPAVTWARTEYKQYYTKADPVQIKTIQ